MKILKHIPNLLTLLNLLSGTIATIYAVNNELVTAAYFVFLGIFFDFFDGLAARLLNVSGDFGKQLDSLADMVTSGVVPGIVMFQLINENKVIEHYISDVGLTSVSKSYTISFLAVVGLLITLGAAYRLAKFNIDERQTSSFVGLPTPAATIVILSFPLILAFSQNELAHSIIRNQWFLIGITLLLTYLMNAEIPLFALKFTNFSWKDNKLKFSYLVLTILLLILLKFIAIPIAILLYVLLSLINNCNVTRAR